MLLATVNQWLAKAENEGEPQQLVLSHMKALALYRNGAISDCLQVAQKCRHLGDGGYPPFGIAADLLSAMAYQQLGMLGRRG